jgi:uncharacterized protein (DUF1697 family)
MMISMLRGVNVGGHNMVKMAELKALYESLGFTKVVTYVNSGNVVFDTKEKDHAKIGKKIEAAMEKKFGFRVDIVLRSADELKKVIAKNPFAKREDIDPGKLLVVFLGGDPGETGRDALVAMDAAGEELKPLGSEIYIYFVNGQGKTKLKWAQMEKAFNKLCWTGRNWNTVMKLNELSA